MFQTTNQTMVGDLGSFGFGENHLTNDVTEVFQLDILLGSNGKSCGFTISGGSSITLGLRRGRM